MCGEHHLGHVALFFVTWLVRGLTVFGQDVFCPETTDMGDWALKGQSYKEDNYCFSRVISSTRLIEPLEKNTRSISICRAEFQLKMSFMKAAMRLYYFLSYFLDATSEQQNEQNLGGKGGRSADI